VEFIRTIGADTGPNFNTGHGNEGVERSGDPVFQQRVGAFAGEIAQVEHRIHAEAESERPPANAAPGPIPDLREPSSRPVRASGPPFAGLRISGDASIASQGGATRFGGVVGADLVLGRLSSLNLGVRGVYLTPDRLLVGGTLGVRFLQPGDAGSGRAVENPIFFDIEAGVVGQLNSAESARIMERVAGFGSAGFGQEYGTSGSRVFWRLGGYAIVSDRGQWSGGGSLGVGVRFQ
jgi:hypothetical protein